MGFVAEPVSSDMFPQVSKDLQVGGSLDLVPQVSICGRFISVS